jgi:hypothetical protein
MAVMAANIQCKLLAGAVPSRSRGGFWFKATGAGMRADWQSFAQVAGAPGKGLVPVNCRVKSPQSLDILAHLKEK